MVNGWSDESHCLAFVSRVTVRQHRRDGHTSPTIERDEDRFTGLLGVEVAM